MHEKYHIEVEINKLTNSILNRISGDSFSTEVQVLTKSDFKNITKTKGWLFNWASEAKQTDRGVYKLYTQNNSDVIQGLVSMSNYGDHFYLYLIKNVSFNLGKSKLYEDVPGNLFAFTCKISWDIGYQGFVSFTAKTKSLGHYENIRCNSYRWT